MNYYDQSTQKVLAFVNSDEKTGLTNVSLKENSLKYGYNRLSEKKKKSIIKRVGDSLKEPMLLILLFGFIVTLGVNIGKFLKTGDGDFVECFGILFAVILSVSITVVMEGSSQKAFESLNKIYENLTVKVITLYCRWMRFRQGHLQLSHRPTDSLQAPLSLQYHLPTIRCSHYLL